MKTTILLIGLLFAGSASAAPENFRSCNTSLVLHNFIDCRNDSDECRVEREELGTLTVDLSVESPEKASGSAIFKGKDGRAVAAPLACALTDENGDVNDMFCLMEKPANERLGHLSLSFNSAEAPYYAAVFYEYGNAPIGNFSTSEDCQ
jgi:hypothetical protein